MGSEKEEGVATMNEMEREMEAVKEGKMRKEREKERVEIETERWRRTE